MYQSRGRVLLCSGDKQHTCTDTQDNTKQDTDTQQTHNRHTTDTHMRRPTRTTRRLVHVFLVLLFLFPSIFATCKSCCVWLGRTSSSRTHGPWTVVVSISQDVQAPHRTCHPRSYQVWVRVLVLLVLLNLAILRDFMWDEVRLRYLEKHELLLPSTSRELSICAPKRCVRGAPPKPSAPSEMKDDTHSGCANVSWEVMRKHRRKVMFIVPSWASNANSSRWRAAATLETVSCHCAISPRCERTSSTVDTEVPVHCPALLSELALHWEQGVFNVKRLHSKQVHVFQ